MRKICSFCNGVIQPGTSPNEPAVHGVCPSCQERISAQRGFNVRKYLDMLDAPVFLVDSDVNILEANSFALAVVKKPIDLVRWTRGGNVLECINSFLDEGCGKTVFCPNCMIRGAVNETYKTGRPITKQPATLCRKVGNTTEKLNLLVSTRKEGYVVLLRVEPAEPAQMSRDQQDGCTPRTESL